MSQSIQNRLFKATNREARAGAKIVVYSEVAPFLAPEDEQQFIDTASKIAKD